MNPGIPLKETTRMAYMGSFLDFGRQSHQQYPKNYVLASLHEILPSFAANRTSTPTCLYLGVPRKPQRTLHFPRKPHPKTLSTSWAFLRNLLRWPAQRFVQLCEGNEDLGSKLYQERSARARDLTGRLRSKIGGSLRAIKTREKG